MSNMIANDISNEIRVLDASEIDGVAGGFCLDRIGRFLKDVAKIILRDTGKPVTVK